MVSPSEASALVSAAHEADDWAIVNDEAEIEESAAAEHSRATGDAEEEEEEQQAPTSEPRAATETQSDAVPDGFLRVRLRIGENVRGGWFNATQSVEDFTKLFFADEIANGKKIRLIYLGMLLTPGRSMGEYGVEEDGVIHGVITDAPPAAHPQAARDTELKGLSDPSTLLLALTGVFLYGLWTLFYHLPHLFSWKSVLLLAAFSAMHVSAAVSRFTSTS